MGKQTNASLSRTALACFVLSVSAFAGCNYGGGAGQGSGPLSASQPDPQSLLFPSALTEQDIMTDLDLLYIHDLQIATAGGSIADWPLIQQLRRVSIDVADSVTLANHLNFAFPIEGQPEFQDVAKLVDECCKVLEVPPPQVFIKQSGATNAYVTGLEEPHILVITSGLLDAYQDHPQELKFILGHELGHIKANHIRAHLIGRIVVQTILSGENWVADHILTPLVVWKLLEWHRASEKTADRAGLLCIGHSPNQPDYARSVAQQSLIRLLHGTERQIDLKAFRSSTLKLEKDAPFIQVMRKIQTWGRTHPFVLERCAAVEQWSESEEYSRLLRREAGIQRHMLTIDSLKLVGLPQADIGPPEYRECDPFVQLYVGSNQRRTRHFNNRTEVYLADLNWKFPWVPNTRAVIIIQDFDQLSSSETVGQVVLPIPEKLGSFALQTPFGEQRNSSIEVTYTLN